MIILSLIQGTFTLKLVFLYWAVFIYKAKTVEEANALLFAQRQLVIG